jgi:tetratricopeptide (TPR) repeat protein
LIDQLLRFDASLVTDAETAQARAAFDGYVERVASCTDVSCVVETLLADGSLSTDRAMVAPRANTASYALVEGRGSCAALVAVVLAVASERRPLALDAVVFRDHVVLASTVDREVYYEVLDGGRVLEPPELAEYTPPPGGPVRVDAEGYLPYYVDNLAARLAEAGRDDEADGFFRESLALVPDTARVNYNYGTFLLRRQRDVDALAHLDRAIELGWADADAWVNRGVALWNLDRSGEARTSFETALELEPTNRDARLNLKKIADAGSH